MDSDSESSSHSSEEFYDKDADSRDAEWMSKQHPGNTDAVLACPMCFTQICFVCQRHARYAGQYRAISVVHCTVKDELYAFSSRGVLEPSSQDSEETFRLVVCSECGTKVGVKDHQDIYHLFNVIDNSQL